MVSRRFWWTLTNYDSLLAPANIWERKGHPYVAEGLADLILARLGEVGVVGKVAEHADGAGHGSDDVLEAAEQPLQTCQRKPPSLCSVWGAYRGRGKDLDRVVDVLGNLVGLARQVSDLFDGAGDVGGRDDSLDRRGGQEGGDGGEELELHFGGLLKW